MSVSAAPQRGQQDFGIIRVRHGAALRDTDPKEKRKMKSCRNSLVASLGVVLLVSAWSLAAPDVAAIRKKIVARYAQWEESHVDFPG